MWANKKNNTGFTIVETLIVLAVSGVMFVSVASLISGQVARNQSRQAANNIEIYVRDAINDVSTGYYPETGQKFTCVDTGAPKPSVTPNAAGPERGSNADCVFAGKLITFKSNSMEVDTLVALATLPTTTSPTTQLAVVDSLKEVKQYPYSVRRTAGDKQVYILNKLLSPTAAQETMFISGSQDVSVVKSDNSTSTAGFAVCFDNNAKLVIGENRSSRIKVEQGVSSCAETL